LLSAEHQKVGDEFEQPFANSKQKGNREAKALYEERMTEGVNTGEILKEEMVGEASEIAERGHSERCAWFSLHWLKELSKSDQTESTELTNFTTQG